MHNHHHEISSHDELLALLKYMVSHNKSHTVELEKLSSKLNNENLASAIEAYSKGNEYLEKALTELEEE